MLSITASGRLVIQLLASQLRGGKGPASGASACWWAMGCQSFTSSVVVRTSIVPVPPVGASGDQSLTPQPPTTVITVTIVVVARPPPQSNSDEPVVEVIVVVMYEVIMVAMPRIVAMPHPGPTVPGHVTAVPATTTGAGEVGATHAANTKATPGEVTSSEVAAASTKSAPAHVATTTSPAAMSDEDDGTLRDGTYSVL